MSECEVVGQDFDKTKSEDCHKVKRREAILKLAPPEKYESQHSWSKWSEPVFIIIVFIVITIAHDKVRPVTSQSWMFLLALMFVWMPAAQSWIHLNKWVMTLFLASTWAKSIHRLCGCVWACVHPCKWVQVLCVCLCTYASVYARLWVSVCASCLESRVSLRWATADILVCFNPLANKTAGNHQKNTSSWTGRTAWEKIGEEVCTPVWMKNKLRPGSRERGEKGEGGLSTRCRKKSAICVVCVCVCHSMEEVTLAAAVSVASVQRHLTTCIYHSLIEGEG